MPYDSELICIIHNGRTALALKNALSFLLPQQCISKRVIDVIFVDAYVKCLLITIVPLSGISKFKENRITENFSVALAESSALMR